jgi:hypothetical protein
MTHQPDGGSSGVNAGGVVLLIAVTGGAAAGATQTSDAGPILAFVGAVLAVAVTAVTTNRRQAHQLAADAARNREVLEAEGDRLAMQLSHERKLADLQHLRELLDSTAAAYEEAARNCATFSSILTVNDEDVVGAPRRRDAFRTAEVSNLTIANELHRLEMRFDPKHHVFIEFAAVRNYLGNRYDLLSDVWIASERLGNGSEKWKESVALSAQASEAFTRFAAAARQEIGIREAAVNTS